MIKPIKTILKHLDTIEVDFTGYEVSTNDEKIIEIAKNANQLYTEDALMTVLALKQGIPVFNPEEYYNHQEYFGYVEHEISEKEEELLIFKEDDIIAVVEGDFEKI